MGSKFEFKLLMEKYNTLTKFSLTIYDRINFKVAGVLIFSINKNIKQGIGQTFSEEHINIILDNNINLYDELFIYLDYLFVEKEYQNKKLANKLMNKFIDICKTKHKSINNIFVYASPFKLSATDIEIPVNILVKFYNKFGFNSIVYNDEVDSLMFKVNN